MKKQIYLWKLLEVRAPSFMKKLFNKGCIYYYLIKISGGGIGRHNIINIPEMGEWKILFFWREWEKGHPLEEKSFTYILIKSKAINKTYDIMRNLNKDEPPYIEIL